jgi:hypothetical protein
MTIKSYIQEVVCFCFWHLSVQYPIVNNRCNETFQELIRRTYLKKQLIYETSVILVNIMNFLIDDGRFLMSCIRCF